MAFSANQCRIAFPRSLWARGMCQARTPHHILSCILELERHSLTPWSDRTAVREGHMTHPEDHEVAVIGLEACAQASAPYRNPGAPPQTSGRNF